jgi:hypothetical protein
MRRLMLGAAEGVRSSRPIRSMTISITLPAGAGSTRPRSLGLPAARADPPEAGRRSEASTAAKSANTTGLVCALLRIVLSRDGI